MRLYLFVKMIPFAAMLCCSIGVLQSCHKKKNNTNNTVYDFSIGGNTLVGYNVTFQSTAPATNTFQWNFGDGTSSAGASPTHIYSKVDSYTVTMTVNKNSGTAVSKTIFIATPPDAPFVTAMAGMKYWHGFVIADYQSPTAKDTISSLTDQFGIVVLNSTTLALKDDTLGCYYTDTINHIYYFRHIITPYSSWREVDYFYATGTIRYIYYPDQGGDPKSGPYSFATVLWNP